MTASEVGQFLDSDVSGFGDSSEEHTFDSIPSTVELESSGTPLNTSWTFWLDRSVPNSTLADVEANLKKIYKVSTVESFWAVYNNVPDVDKLGFRYSYHLMRNDIKPMWEDPSNEHGGDWKFKVQKSLSGRAWKELLLATIGERFTDCIEPEDEICGVSVSIRGQEDILQVWNKKSAVGQEAVSKVVDMVTDVLGDIEINTHFYKSHEKHHAFEHGSNK